MDGISRIIERNIKKAIDQGVFDDLPGKGKAQRLADLRFVPPEQRAAFLVLRNSGSLPPEMELRKEIASLEEQLQIAMEEDKPGIIKAITEKKMFYDILMERRKR
ncbi:DnaJ family domain-containing protein [Sporomusa sp.]|uniref:DnaJ family domain-containing protein n=1 Tax=Sporomusa sp. TaxID=2078658 RepID=UPI002B509113|nr:DnaJ family domain-containing protein [Sporomusa sp.]HWR43568.1 DnaJ family domain-containing protein [Sporomusa sp.]